MKYSKNQIPQAQHWKHIMFVSALFLLTTTIMQAQDETKDTSADKKPVKNVFESSELMDVQSVVVPSAKTLTFNMQHRFGTVQNGFTDLWGVYAPANIRIGFNYTPINNLAVGFGYTKFNRYLDMNLKYSILKQRKDWSIPVSITYYGTAAVNTRTDETFAKSAYRWSFYHELSIATKLNSKISLQVTPSFSHFNAVDSLYKNDVIAIAGGGRYKLSPQSSLMVTYMFQFTKYPTNPNFKLKPGVTIGWEISTSAHAFQLFFTNFQGIVPQENIARNSFDFFKGEFLLGFNITRLWSF